MDISMVVSEEKAASVSYPGLLTIYRRRRLIHICMYVYIYIYIYTHTHMYIYVYIYIYTHIHVQAYVMYKYVL